MKKLMILACMLIAGFAQAQDSTLYRLLFADRSNFSFLKEFGHTVPKQFAIRDTTGGWGAEQFWLEGLDTTRYAGIENWRKDEHHPYHRLVWRKIPLLDYHLDMAEKKAMAARAAAQVPAPISIRGRGYGTSRTAAKAACSMRVSAPVYNSRGTLALMQVWIEFEGKDGWSGDAAQLIAVFTKADGKWRKLAASGGFIL